MKPTTMYLIDGVRVSRKVFNRRRMFGEHAAANFQVVEVYPAR